MPQGGKKKGGEVDLPEPTPSDAAELASPGLPPPPPSSKVATTKAAAGEKDVVGGDATVVAPAGSDGNAEESKEVKKVRYDTVSLS